MRSNTPSRKRSEPVHGDAISLLPTSKKARFEAGNLDEELAWESVGQGQDGDIGQLPSPVLSRTSTESANADITFMSTTPVSTSKRPKNYLCEYQDCAKAFDRPTKLRIHMRSHTNERPYACEQQDCHKTFLRIEHLRRHEVDKHSDKRNHVCTYTVEINRDGNCLPCGKSFQTATRLRRHVAAHEEKEQTKCHEPGCGKVFRKQQTLQRHFRKDHLNEKPFRCSHTTLGDSGEPEECGQAFATTGLLKGHQSREHSGFRYHCDTCSPPQIDEDEDEVLRMASETNRVSFATYADLQAHMKTVHLPHCPECGKECQSNRALKAHRDIEHSSLPERQLHKCTWPSCDRSFTKAGNLKVHLQNVHAKARNFVCGLFELAGNEKTAGWNEQGCGSAFGTKANLEDHIRTQHLGIAPKIRPSRLKKMIKSEDADSPSTLMDIDEVPTPDQNGAIAMLTGFGYERSKHIACLISSCQLRFSHLHDMAPHLELTHGWHIDDVNDALAEHEALSGEKFWIGGGEEAEMAARADEDLRTQLQRALSMGGTGSGAPSDDAAHASESTEVTQAQWDAMQDMRRLPLLPDLAKAMEQADFESLMAAAEDHGPIDPTLTAV